MVVWVFKGKIHSLKLTFLAPHSDGIPKGKDHFPTIKGLRGEKCWFQGGFSHFPFFFDSFCSKCCECLETGNLQLTKHKFLQNISPFSCAFKQKLEDYINISYIYKLIKFEDYIQINNPPGSPNFPLQKKGGKFQRRIFQNNLRSITFECKKMYLVELANLNLRFPWKSKSSTI